MVEVGTPLTLPELPQEVSSTDSTATFDLDGMFQLKRYRIASEANTTIAQENALALEARNTEVNKLIECSRYMGVWIQVHAEDLKDERRAHFIDNLKYQLAIGLGVIAVIL